jgi:GMP synthase-like glutamine amidotransferase
MSIQYPPQSMQSVQQHDAFGAPNRAGLGSRAAILQRSARAPIGLLADVLDARGLDWQQFRLEGEPDVPDPAEIALAVAIGSDASGDAARPSSGRTEVDWLRRADAAGASILGIGSGAQTLAVALGGGIERARRPRTAGHGSRPPSLT